METEFQITFFKVIRNKYLFKKIMGYINDEILHLELMIKHNRISLLMKSVFKREPLLFSSYICDIYSWSNDTIKILEDLFKLVNIKNKDQQIQQINKPTTKTNKETILLEIQSFYESFFQQYQDQLDFKKMLISAVEFKNLKAVQVILDNGYFKITDSQLIKDHLIIGAFKSISLKMVKYVFGLFAQLKDGDQLLKEIKYSIAQVTTNFIKFEDQNKFKIINYLLDQDIIQRETIFSKKSNIFIIPMVGFFDDDPFYYHYTVCHLIDAIKLYSSDKLIGSVQNSKNNFDQIKLNLQYLKVSIDNSFSKQELKTKIKKLILKDDMIGTKFNGNLKLVLETYQLVIKKPMVLKYLKYEINAESPEKRKKYRNQLAHNLSLAHHPHSAFFESKYIKQSLKYGNLDFLSVQTNNRVVVLEDIYRLKRKNLNSINWVSSKRYDVLFKHCKDFVGRDYLENFIDSILMENGENSTLMDVFTLVCQLIELNDIPLLEYSLKKHTNNIVDNLKKKWPSVQNQIRFVSSISSIEMLNYCWANAKQYFNGLFTRVSIASCYETGRIDLLSRYEELICVNQKPLSIGDGLYFKYFASYSSLNGNILKTICYMIGKPELYDTSNESVFKCIERSLDKHLFLDEIKFIISNTKCDYYPIIFNIPNDINTRGTQLLGNVLRTRFDKNDIYLKMVKWIYNNRLDDILNKRFKIHYSTVLFQIGKFDLFLDQPIEPNQNDLILISKEIVRTNSEIGLLKLFELYKSNPSKHLESIKLFIIGCCQYGRLNIIKYIFNNHFNVIQNSSVTIDTLLHTAISFGNFNILEYIMLKLNIKEINESFLKSVPSGLNFNYLNKLN